MPGAKPSTAPHILLVEDNPGDVRLMREALRNGDNRNRLTVVDNGEEALAFLAGNRQHTASSRPDLIFLDLNLPGRDGREVLAEIKRDESLRRIPVVVFTTSESEQDIENAYDLYANCYVKKPVDLDEYLSVVKQCETFWLYTVKLPPK